MKLGQEIEHVEPATALSRRQHLASVKPRILRLAWLSLPWLSIMTFVSSCIVADPPTYTDPGVTRPELATIRAVPPVYQVVVIQTSSPSTPTFSVPVRSEDAGDKLLVNFFLDYKTSNQKFIDSQLLDPSTYNDTNDREVSLVWSTVGTNDNGCHTVSAVVAHFASYNMGSAQLLPENKAATDGAVITWWVNLNPDPNGLTNLLNCPTAQVTVK